MTLVINIVLINESDYNNIYLTNLSLDKIIKKERGNQLLITTRLDTDDSINIMFVCTWYHAKVCTASRS